MSSWGENAPDPRASGPVRPGALSALLQELAGAGDDAAWDRALGPGAVIGRFELLRELGHGGFGVVWEARDRELGRTVAFKALRPGRRARMREEQLLREAEMAARLSHRNIVTLYDVGRTEHGPYLVLELLHGETLAQRLKQGPRSVTEALRISTEVAKGLAHAHAHGVVHRDLTPGNVFLCEEGQVKVLDFGMAHAFGRRKLDGGTPAFMAPEQWRGAPEDERTDVFALGVILYQMLSGKLPFSDGKELEGPRPAPTVRVAEEPGLSVLLGRLLEKDPVNRPRDAGEVLAALAALQQTPEHSPPASSEAIAIRYRRDYRRAALLALVSLLAFVPAVVWYLLRHGDSQPPAPAEKVTLVTQSRRSIAVLPFADMSPQSDQQYLADGIAEEILNALAHVEGLRIVGRSSSFSFREKKDDLRVIGRKLDAGTLLEGTVRRAGDRLRVSAQLIDVASGYQLWAETYNRKITDIFEVQEEIAAAVVRALEIHLHPGHPSAPTDHRTASTDAYQQYLIGKHLFYRGTDESSRLGAKAFEKAISIDPGFAPAYAQLSGALVDLSLKADGAAARTELRRRAVAAADQAVALAPDLAEAFSARGLVRSYFGRNWSAARADYQRAVTLNPRSAQEHRRIAIFLARHGELEQAIRSARTALEFDPLAGVTWRWLALFHAANGRIDLARSAVARAIEILPESEYAHAELAGYAVLDGHPSEALSELRHLREDDRLLITAFAEHDLGHAASAQRALDQLIARIAPRDAESIAAVYAWWGERDRAFEWLARAIREGQVTFIKMNPFLRSLHGDPRWNALVDELGLPRK